MVCSLVTANECMFNDTPARKTDRLLGVREKGQMHEMVIKLKIERY